MYAIKLSNGAIIGRASLVSAVTMMRANIVVVGVVRRVDGKVVVKKGSK